ncbi:IQ-DOMAIN 1 [Olea europaea subsp. europaea]|uniref:IQ-DOMAIN 1 n=1 Tax=Olea europaea subsp. europaea TaxID=158383 RepID=A0A8S0RPV2_OLEEU|nr:IQ-DOMAIN 1 [Olea europaea subsp. europaea]
MGSGVWFKNLMSKKKVRGDRSQFKLKRYSTPEMSNGQKEEYGLQSESFILTNSASEENRDGFGMPIEEIAATQIQKAYRAYTARKIFRRLKAAVRLQSLLQCDTVRKQNSTTLGHLHSWTKIQAQIRARRVHMVTEGRLRQKKLENQSKLESKLNDLEVEWSGGSKTMDEALARINQREEAALRRERAMAYAFSHQWRANSNPNFGSGSHDVGKANWDWSWIDRWIAAQPWESRVVPSQSTPKKPNGRQSSKTNRNKNSPTIKTPVPVKSISSNGKTANKARKLSYGASEKMIAAKKVSKSEEVKTKREKEV